MRAPQKQHFEFYLLFHCTTIPKPDYEADAGYVERVLDTIHATILDTKTLSPLHPECWKRQIYHDFKGEDQHADGTLAEIIAELEAFVKRTTGCAPHYGEAGSQKLIPVTFGAEPLRLYLHFEAFRDSVALSSHFYQFIDARKLALKAVAAGNQLIDSRISLPALLSHFNVAQPLTDQLQPCCADCPKLCALLQHLKALNHTFSPSVEKIQHQFEPDICVNESVIKDTNLIRLRGLPWQTSDVDLANFFKGLNCVRGGIAVCLGTRSRRTGEALLAFEDEEQRDIALMKHRYHMGQRYLEIYKACARDFFTVCGEFNEAAHKFYKKGARCVIRMRGLPFCCTDEDVVNFFQREPVVNVLGGRSGIKFVELSDGKRNGDAFVLFRTEAEAELALAHHRSTVANRYVELFKSSPLEIQQVLNKCDFNVANKKTNQLLPPRPAPLTSLAHPNIIIPTQVSPVPFYPYQFVQQTPVLQATTPEHKTDVFDQSLQKTIVRMRGLPVDVSVQDVVRLLGDLINSVCVQGIHIVYSVQGVPIGEALVRFVSEEAVRALVARFKPGTAVIVGGKSLYLSLTVLTEMDLHQQGFSPSPTPSPDNQVPMALPSPPGTFIQVLVPPDCTAYDAQPTIFVPAQVVPSAFTPVFAASPFGQPSPDAGCLKNHRVLVRGVPTYVGQDQLANHFNSISSVKPTKIDVMPCPAIGGKADEYDVLLEFQTSDDAATFLQSRLKSTA